ncbi:MAG: MotA/TolQ/ExbB proton channel family protein [Acidobacteria bacterium]|nr:MotA/TolQ/ExbB proton channel family protein [Acidobacteriota bacterium]
MDASTVIGLIVAVTLIGAAIALGDRPVQFIDVASLLIVLGGTLGVTFIKNPLGRVFSTFAVVRNAFTRTAPQPDDVIAELVELSRTARRESLLALERREIADPFLARAVALAVDGYEPDTIRQMLETETAALAERHKYGQELLEGMAYSAPAFGMIGTLIGLVRMLSTLEEPAKIGPAMALAILTTLYGSLIAYLICLPLAEKLKNRSREEVAARRLVLEGILAIVEGDHPTSVRQKLTAHIPPAQRTGSARRRDTAAA